MGLFSRRRRASRGFAFEIMGDYKNVRFLPILAILTGKTAKGLLPRSYFPFFTEPFRYTFDEISDNKAQNGFPLFASII